MQVSGWLALLSFLFLQSLQWNRIEQWAWAGSPSREKDRKKGRGVFFIFSMQVSWWYVLLLLATHCKVCSGIWLSSWFKQAAPAVTKIRRKTEALAFCNASAIVTGTPFARCTICSQIWLSKYCVFEQAVPVGTKIGRKIEAFVTQCDGNLYLLLLYSRMVLSANTRQSQSRKRSEKSSRLSKIQISWRHVLQSNMIDHVAGLSRQYRWRQRSEERSRLIAMVSTSFFFGQYLPCNMIEWVWAGSPGGDQDQKKDRGIGFLQRMCHSDRYSFSHCKVCSQIWLSKYSEFEQAVPVGTKIGRKIEAFCNASVRVACTAFLSFSAKLAVE